MKKNITIIILLLMLLSLAACGSEIAETTMPTEKVSPEQEYMNTVAAFLSAAIEGESLAFEICDITYAVWYDAYYQEYRAETAPYTMTNGTYYDDFNYALYLLSESDTMISALEKLSDNRNQVNALYVMLSAQSEEYSEYVTVIDAVYLSYHALAEIAKTPNGMTLEGYYNDCVYLNEAFAEAAGTLQILVDAN